MHKSMISKMLVCLLLVALMVSSVSGVYALPNFRLFRKTMCFPAMSGQ